MEFMTFCSTDDLKKEESNLKYDDGLIQSELLPNIKQKMIK